MAARTSNDRLGSVFAGKYRLDSLLGEGGMGAVYKATDVNLDRTVALKLIRRELASDPQFAARFKREAKVAAKFDHPNSISIYDFGTDDEGDCYMVLEFVRGHELRELIKAKGGLSPQRSVTLLGQVLGALSEAHELGIVHRDLKPANVMVQDGDQVKILDFGIAKMRSDDQTNALTMAGEIMGTIAYMAPEQTEGSDVDGRADLYAAGVMLFQMLSGSLPFAGRNALEMIKMHRNSPVPSLASVRSGVPEGFQAVIDKALAKKPEERYATGAAFREALEAVPVEGLDTAALRQEQTTVNRTNGGSHRTGSTEMFYEGLIGKTLDGDLLIQKKLGAGGMGAVFKAKSSLLGSVVAVKVIHPQLADRSDVRQRFLREARAALEFIHPNAIPTRTCRQTPDGLLYMTMDFSEGHSLRRIIDEGGRLEPTRALVIARQVLHAVAEAHRKGIVHRDLKPENMLVEDQTGGERVRVCDFGIAKIMAGGDGDDTSLTGQQVLGTPHYMAPEQAGGDGVDGRTDIYAVGCVLYEMLTGTRVFKAKTAMDVLMKHITNTPEPISKRAPDAGFPPELESLVAKALEKAPTDRFQEADEFIEAIEALPLALPASSFRVTSTSRPVLDPKDIEPTIPPRPPHGSRSSKGIALGVVALFSFLFAVGLTLDEKLRSRLSGLISTSGTADVTTGPDEETHEDLLDDPTVEITPTVHEGPAPGGDPDAPTAPQDPADPPATQDPPTTQDPPATQDPPTTQDPVATQDPPTQDPPTQDPVPLPPADPGQQDPQQPATDPPATDPANPPSGDPAFPAVEPVEIPTTPPTTDTPRDPFGTPRPTNAPVLVDVVKGNISVRMARLPNHPVRVDRQRKVVQDVWVSAHPLTIGQFARGIDMIKQPRKKYTASQILKDAIKRRRPGKRLLGFARGMRTDPSWAWNAVPPSVRDQPMTGIPQHMARDLAKQLGMRLPTKHEWSLAASLGARAGIAGMDEAPYEWLSESNWAGAGPGHLKSQPPQDRVGVRFAMDRK